MKRLLVFPGLSSPYYPKYAPVYDLLREEGARMGAEVTVVLYPGQTSASGSSTGQLSPALAAQRAAEALTEAERAGRPYRTLGISFGCYVSLRVAADAADRTNWQDAVIWGPVPHCMAWQSFGCGTRNENLGKGTTFIDSSAQFYRELVPVEHLLTQVDLPVAVGVGATDPYVPEAFLTYLRSLCEGAARTSHRFAYLPGCSHNVAASDPGHQAYLDLVFG